MEYKIITTSKNISDIENAIFAFYKKKRWYENSNVIRYKDRIVFPDTILKPNSISSKICKISNFGKNYVDIFIVRDDIVFVLDKAYNKLSYTTKLELMKTRLGAKLGTENFPNGTVGYGVHASISVIKWGLNDLGGVLIGEVFNSPEAQRIMALPDTKENNLKIAKLEYQYWLRVKKESESYSENRFGGNMGSFFEPESRIKWQALFAYIRGKNEQIDLLIQKSKNKIIEYSN